MQRSIRGLGEIRETAGDNLRPNADRIYGGLDMPDGWEWLGPVISQSYTRVSKVYHGERSGEARAVLGWLVDHAGYLRLRTVLTPFSDRFMEDNETLLNFVLGEVRELTSDVGIGASVDLWGEKADEDGIFRCATELHFQPFDADAAPYKAAIDGAPVEVGVTRAVTTLRHLRQAGSLVRWAYGDDYVTLISVRPGFECRRFL